MNNLIVRAVPFMGDELMAARDEETGKIYAGVKWLCDGVGLTTGQMQNERSTIQMQEQMQQSTETEYADPSIAPPPKNMPADDTQKTPDAAQK